MPINLDPTPVSRANMDPRFEGCISDLQAAAAVEYAQRSIGGQTPWFRPGDWAGDVFDAEGISVPFADTVANENFVEGLTSPDAPGTSGDAIVTTTMIDTLACMERAFRVRHTLNRPRGMAHMLARKNGHANAEGPLVLSYIQYCTNLLAQGQRS